MTENSNDIIFRVAKPKQDTENVREFIRKFYYPEEPISIGNEPKQHSIEDEEYSLSLLNYNTTIVAVNSITNEIVGIILSGPLNSNDPIDTIKASEQMKDKKWSEILKLLGTLALTANVCERFNVNKSLHMQVLAVNPKMRGQSIGLKLFIECMENGKQMGYKLASADCTSVYSIKLAEKLNMEEIQTLKYSDYLDNNGKQIFNPPLPHLCIKTFIKKL